MTGVPNPTWRVDGIQLCGAVDPVAEARLQASQVPMEATEARVYDPAQGALPAALLARSQIRHLEVVLLAPAAFLATLEGVDHAWLGDPRVHLRRAGLEERPQVPYALSPAALRLAESRAWNLRDRLVLEAAAAHQAQGYAARFAGNEQTLRENADLLASSLDLRELLGTRAGRRAVVAAAGPTLSEELPWLRAGRGEVTLVAVNSSLIPLLKAGIVPDFVVAVDEHPSIANHLRVPPEWREACTSVPLVHVVTLVRAALQEWPGPRYAARLQLPRFEKLKSPEGQLWCSGTVTHSACDLARQLGASDLVLLGADFGYPGGRSHAEGAVAAADLRTEHRKVRVADGRGGDIPTDVNLLGYLRDLDDWCGRNTQFPVLKRGRSGAAMTHAPWMDDV